MNDSYRTSWTRRLAVVCVAMAGAVHPAAIDPAVGQDQKQPRPSEALIDDLAASHPVSAYIDHSTVFTAEIDWAKIDVDAFFDSIQKLTGDRPSEQPIVKALFAQLQAAQAGKIFVIAGLQTVTDGTPLVVVPTPDPEKLLKSMQGMFGENVQIAASGSALLFGDPLQIERQKSFKPLTRSDMIAPMRDANRLDHTAVLAMPRSTREMLWKLWPKRQPDGFPVDLSPSQMAKDIKRVIVTLRTPPDPLMRLTIESVDDEAADRVSKVCADLKQRFKVALAGVTFKRDEHQITLEADRDAVLLAEAKAVAARQATNRSRMVGTLKKLGLAIHHYQQREQHLPPRCFVDLDGNPLHSWLVAILPDFNNLAFYRSLKLDRRWDDSANARLRNTTPAGIGDQSLPVAFTSIRAPVYPGSLWQGDGPPKRLSEVTDATSQTIMLVDAPSSAAIHWADPESWVISEDDPMTDVFGARAAARVLMVDGSVRLLKKAELDDAKLKAMLTIAGGD